MTDITTIAAGRGQYDQTHRIIGASAGAVSLTGTVAETAMASVTLPAGAMGRNGILRITTLWTVTNSANNKTLYAKLGSTGFFSRVVTAVVSVSNCTMIRNRGTEASQIAFFNGGGASGGWGDNTNANTTGTVNTAVAQTITFNGQLANSGETITLESWLVELIKID